MFHQRSRDPARLVHIRRNTCTGSIDSATGAILYGPCVSLISLSYVHYTFVYQEFIVKEIVP